MTTFTSRPGLRFLSLLVIALLCAATAHAQSGGTGTIYGRVIDAGSNKALPEAEIMLQGSAIVVHTDQGGFFTMQAPAGEAAITVNYAGYVLQTKTITVETGRTTPLAEFDMDLLPERKTVGLAASDVVMLEKMTVSTQRAGNARAYMEQKNSMNLASIVATDAFGGVANGSITDFMKNIPGVQLGIGDSGEAATLSVDGLDPANVAVTMNGAPMASGGGGFGSGGRSFQFDQVNIETIDSISLNRMLAADMPGDSAVTIDFRQKSAFDYRGARFTYRAYLTANSYNFNLKSTPDPAGGGSSHKILPGIAFSYSTPFRHNTMGLTVNFMTQQDYAESGQLTNGYAAYGFEANVPYAYSVTYTSAPQLNQRLSAGVTYDWKISPFAKLRVGFTYDLRNTTKYVFSTNFSSQQVDYYANPDTSSLTRIFASDYSNTYPTLSGANSYSTGYTDNFNVSFEWKRNRFSFDALAQFSYANNKTLNGQEGWFSSVNMRGPRFHDFILLTRPGATDPGWTFKQGPNGIQPGVTTPATVLPGTSPYPYQNADVTDIGIYGQNGASVLTDPMPTTRIQGTPYIRANLRWDAPTAFQMFFKAGFIGQKTNFNWWTPTNSGGGTISNSYQFVGPSQPDGTLWMGTRGSGNGNWDNQNNDSGSGAISIGSTAPTTWVAANGDAPLPVPLLSSQYWVSAYHFDPHLGGNMAALNLPFIDRSRLWNEFQSHPEYFYVKQYAQGSQTDLNNYIASMSAQKNLSELTWAGYLMGQAQPIRKVTINAGVRYEFTKQTADSLIPYTSGQMTAMGWSADMASDPNWAFQYASIQYKNGARTHTEKTYDYLLPRVFVRYDWTPNLTLNAGYNESYNRVDVSKIAGQWSIGSTTATAPNPDLEPNHYHSLSAALDYYFEPGGSISLTYVYRYWNGFAYNLITVDPDSPLWQSLASQYGQDTMDAFQNGNYTVQTYDNGDKTNRHIQSFTINYRQQIPFIQGLTVNFGYTRIVPSWRKTGTQDGGMKSTPKQITSSIQYSHRGFLLNVRGNWTDRTWTNVDSVDWYSWTADYARFTMDAEVSYRVTKQFSIFAMGSNILNAPQASFIAQPDILYKQTTNGANFTFGIRGEF